ncbi:metallophosphoesterase family protein [Bradyrhizobium prioriisuperbiae]|uniref:metallophosphoesterase family protein n=1 Tax=Bradyrhizobium prioriisuperbiae TaxID=2854389 RepID=UPI0028EA5AAA|nr:metallophosphoesterase [Bradyrhizobium prioritasuperba]
MTSHLIAHVTDAHIGQKVFAGSAIGTSKMAYGNDPDAHRANLKTIFDDLVARRITRLVFGGDIGTAASNPWFFAQIAAYGFDLRLVLGNHDTASNVAPFFSTPKAIGSGELAYVRDDDQVRYIHLDSSSNTISDAQMDWLQRQLDHDQSLVLFIHHPVLEIGTPLDRSGAALAGRVQLRDLLVCSRRDITIFCGHYHMTDETADGNIRQFVTPAASYQIDQQTGVIGAGRASFGYRLISVNGTDITTDVVLFNG